MIVLYQVVKYYVDIFICISGAVVAIFYLFNSINKFKQQQQAQSQVNSKQMPKLKKYSQINNDDSNSVISPSMQAYLPNAQPHAHGNQSEDDHKDESSSSISNTSDNEQSKSVKQISNEKNRKRNKTKSKQKESPNKQRKSSRNTRNKNTQRKSKHKYDADEILKKMQEQCANNEDQQKSKQCEQTDAQIPEDALVGYSGKKNKSKRNKSTGIKVKNKFFDVQVNLDSQQVGQLKQIPQDDKAEIAQLDQQYMRLLSQKNEKNVVLMDQRKQKIELKVNKLRERLDFKGAHEDVRFKDNMKQTLNTVKDCEQVEIEIGAPKIFKGTSAKQTDAALFIKNLSQNLVHQSQSQNQQSAGRSLLSRPDKIQVNNINNNKNKKIDRKQFYQQFTRQVKQINAVEIPTEAQALFKKSSLDELQTQFQKNQHLFKNNNGKTNNTEDQNSRHSMSSSVSQLSNRSRSNQHDNSKPRKSIENRKISREGSEEKKQSSVSNLRLRTSEISKPITVVHEDLSNEQSKANCFPPTQQPKNNNQQLQSENIDKTDEKQLNKQLKTDQNKQQDKPDTEAKKNRNKSKQNKNKSSTKQKKDKASRLSKKQREQKKQLAENEKFRKKISQLFELQAEYSDHGSGDNGDSSQQGDNDSLQSLIDRQQVKYIKKNQKEARKKFMKDQLEKDELIIQKIKQKITAPRKIKCQIEQNSDSRRRRQSRMDEAKKRFERQDQFYQGNLAGNHQHQNYNKKQNQQNQQQTRNDFEQQLKILEEQIGGKEPQKQNSRESIGFYKNKKSKPKIWKQIKTLSRLQKTDKGEKSNDNIKARGGFLNKASSKAVTGIKIKGPQKQTGPKSKSKHINF